MLQKTHRKKLIPWFHRVVIAIVSALTVLFLFAPSEEDLKKGFYTYQQGKLYKIDVSPTYLHRGFHSDSYITWETHSVKKDESASHLFQRIGLSSALLHDLITSNKDINKQLSRLRPKDTLQFGFNEEGDVIQIIRKINNTESFVITRDVENKTYLSHTEKKEVTTQYNSKGGVISSNFWNAATSAGLTGNQIMQLAVIFGWYIDFSLDIRK